LATGDASLAVAGDGDAHIDDGGGVIVDGRIKMP
jgi:hypothetical protein